MILGLGVDLCSIPRMRRAIRSPYFVRRLFRASEIAYADGKGSELARANAYASAFAAREAFAKASGISMYTLALSSEICLERTAAGPRLNVPPQTPGWRSGDGKEVRVSLSHDGDYAVAVVLISKNESCSLPADFRTLRKLLPLRHADMNKEDRGRILVAGGSVSYPGAPVLASLAALRGGGGVVSLLSLPDVCRVCAFRLPEAVQIPVLGEEGQFPWLPVALRELPRTAAAVAGPGLGRSEAALSFASGMWEKWDRPLLMDGDALYALAVSGKGLRRRSDAVLTPHEGEAARLLGTTRAEIHHNREEAARLLAERWGCVLLKGQGTLVAAADGSSACLNAGGPELSVPGSGDVLSGCIGAFLAQGLSPFDAAVLGGSLHALAGRRLRESRGMDGILASEIADGLPFVLNMLREGVDEYKTPAR